MFARWFRRYVVEHKAIEALFVVVKSADAALVCTALDVMLGIMQHGGATETRALVSNNLFRVIKDDVCTHADPTVVAKANEVLDTGFQLIDDA